MDPNGDLLDPKGGLLDPKGGLLDSTIILLDLEDDLSGLKYSQGLHFESK